MKSIKSILKKRKRITGEIGRLLEQLEDETEMFHASRKIIRKKLKVKMQEFYNLNEK